MSTSLTEVADNYQSFVDTMRTIEETSGLKGVVQLGEVCGLRQVLYTHEELPRRDGVRLLIQDNCVVGVPYMLIGQHQVLGLRRLVYGPGRSKEAQQALLAELER
jgi:hypothetical protein